MEAGLSQHDALIKAVQRIGSQAAMARLCGVKQPTVWHWLEKSKRLPAEHVLDVEAATNVSRHDLRPDIYPRGLQDDAPFRPDILELGQFQQLVADEKDVKLQGGAAA